MKFPLPSGLRIRLAGDSLTHSILSKSVSTVILKVLSAGFSFAMFLVLPWSMDGAAYGLFALAFSLGSFLGLVADFGNQQLMLRFVPIYLDAQDQARLKGIVIFGYLSIVLGSLGGMAAMVIYGLVKSDLLSVVLAGLLLVPGIAISNLQSGLLRAQGSIWWALGARELVWRGAIILIVGIAAWSGTETMRPQVAAGLVAGLLIASLLIQMLANRDALMRVFRPGPAVFERKVWRHTALGLWGTGVIQAGGPHLLVVLIGMVLTLEQTGGFFTSIRIALLLSFILMAFNLVTGPMLVRAWHNGEKARVQRICKLSILGSLGPCLLLYLGIVLFARPLLTVFDASFADLTGVLIILATGEVVNVITGQSAIFMAMSGNERKLFHIQLVVFLLSSAALVPMTIWFGELAAAGVVALSRASWNIWASWSAYKITGIDTSILAFLRRKRAGRRPGKTN